MPFLNDYSHDIFISYAHGDNDPELFEGGWVTKFERKLRASLRHQLGRPADIAFDAGLPPNASVERLVEWAARSAVFLVVGSPTYIQREFTLRELKAFGEGNFDQERYFVIELLPLHDGDQYPSSINNQNRMPFYEAPDVRVGPVTFSPGDLKFTAQINLLAVKIKDQLRRMKVSEPTYKSEESSVNVVAPQSARKHQDSSVGGTTSGTRTQIRAQEPLPCRKVLLAQQAGDLEIEHRRARTFLEDYGIVVLPEGDYPQGGKEFSEAFAADARRADIFVQLLGSWHGQRPPDLRKGYLETQADLARTAGIEIMQWRHVQLEKSSILDDRHRATLFGPQVRAESFPDFLEAVKKLAQPTPPTPNLPIFLGKKLAFINADTRDLDIGSEIADKLQTDRLSVILRTYSDSARENRAYLAKSMARADAIFVIYGESDPQWVQAQYFEYEDCRRTRDQDPDVVAICLAPPPGKPKHGVFDSAIRNIDLRMPDMAALLALRDELIK